MYTLYICIYIAVVNKTLNVMLKDTLNKGHNTFNLSIKDKFHGLYRTMVIQFTS